MTAELTFMRYQLLIALALATTIKLLLALLSFGTNDVATWISFLQIAQYGVEAYNFKGISGARLITRLLCFTFYWR